MTQPPVPGNPSGGNWPAQGPGAGGFGAPVEPLLVSIGDINCTRTTVHTPSGSIPVSAVSWNVADLSRTDQRIPPWAIIMAVIFFVFCLLGLLFLLCKETTTTGYLQVTVQGNRFLHTTQIPVSSPGQIADVHARVNYARSLGQAAY